MYKCGRYVSGDIEGVKKMIYKFGVTTIIKAKDTNYYDWTCLHHAASFNLDMKLFQTAII